MQLHAFPFDTLSLNVAVRSLGNGRRVTIEKKPRKQSALDAYTFMLDEWHLMPPRWDQRRSALTRSSSGRAKMPWPGRCWSGQPETWATRSRGRCRTWCFAVAVL